MSPNLPTTHSCPERCRLIALAEGRLSEEEATSVSAHISACRTCDQRLGAIEEQSDDLVRSLAMLPASAEDEETFQALEAELLAHPEPFGADGTTEVFQGDIDTGGPPPTFSLPIQLGNYELLEQIGAGANGAVFRARHRRLEKQVAVKLLLNIAGSAVEEFLNEMRIIGQLDHPNIIQATDAGEHEGVYFLVMEYVPGLDISSLLRQVGPLSVSDAAEITRQAALGLSVAHASSLVHRDVKTSNLLFTSSGQVKLLDLGLATIAARPNESQEHSHTSGPRGTADYMAPEQWREASQVTAKADIYSLGCTLYKLLTGAPPFRPLPDSAASLEAAHLHSSVPDITKRALEKLPQEMEILISRMLAKEPEARPERATDIADALSKYAQEARLDKLVEQVFPESVVPPPRSSLSHAGAPKKHPRRLAMLAAAGTLAALVWRRQSNREQTPATLRTQVWRPLSPAQPPVLRLQRAKVGHAANATTTGQESEATIARGFNAVNPKSATESNKAVPPKLESIDNGFRLATNVPALVHFGKPMTGEFRFRVSIERQPRVGATGVFFRLRPTDTRNFEFHTLQWAIHDGQLTLVWNEYLKRDVGTPTVLAGLELPAPNLRPFKVEVGLGQSGFPQVIFNDELLGPARWTISKEGRELVTAHPSQIATNFMGNIGVFHSPGTTTIISPELRYV